MWWWFFGITFLVFPSVTSSEVQNFLQNETYEWAYNEEPQEIRRINEELVLKIMNASVDPCEDFYEYACGGYPEMDDVFVTAGKLNEKSLLKILLNSTYVPENEAEEKALQYFRICLTDNPLNDSLVEAMEYIDSVLESSFSEEGFNWTEVEAQMTLYGFSIFLEVSNVIDSITINFSDNEPIGIASNWTETEYMNYTAQELAFLNLSHNETLEMATSLMEFQTDLLEFIRNFVNTTSNRTNDFTNYTIEELEVLEPSLDLRNYLSKVLGNELNSSLTFDVIHPVMIKAMFTFFNQTNPKATRNFYRWHIAKNLATGLKNEVNQEESHEKSCFKSTYELFKPVILSIFKRHYFKSNTIEVILDMIERVRAELVKLIQESTWMDQEFQDEAIKKVNAIEISLMYPSYLQEERDLIRDYETFQITPQNFVLNFLNATALRKQQQLKTGQTTTSLLAYVWHNEDFLTASPGFFQLNQGVVLLQAGVLKAPFFNINFPKFHNFGALGSILGHEFMHSFDVTSMEYDSEGERRIWWNEDFNETINTQIDCYVQQYNNYKHDTEIVNGEITVSENIPDNIGMKLALNAYKTWLNENQNSSVIEEEMRGFPRIGLDHMQGFFLSLAQYHCANDPLDPNEPISDTPNEHAPQPYRIIGTVSNSEEFSRIFQCPSSSQMNPATKCSYF